MSSSRGSFRGLGVDYKTLSDRRRDLYFLYIYYLTIKQCQLHTITLDAKEITEMHLMICCLYIPLTFNVCRRF